MRELTVNHTTSTAHRLVHYDGVCANVHGHNMEWDVYLHVEEPETDDAMTIDFKKVSDILDEYDHAILLNEDDALLEYENAINTLGDVKTFEKDPTTEHLSQVVVDRFLEHPQITYAQVNVKETDKYGMKASGSDIEKLDSDQGN